MSGDVLFDISVLFIQEGARALSAVGSIPPSFVYGVSIGVAGYRLIRIHLNNRKFWQQTARNNRQDCRITEIEHLLGITDTTMFPLENRVIGGFRFGQLTWYTLRHLGVDYKAGKGTELRAPFDGEIIAQWHGLQGGKMVYFRSDWDGGKIIRFMHLERYAVGTGRVSKGQVIAYTGNTGLLTTGPHLHMDINQNPSALLAGNLSFSNFIDPEGYNWGGPEVSVPIEVPAPIPPAPAAPFKQNLSPLAGYRSEVERVQRFLESKGYPSAGAGEYGYYGKKTQSAVDGFQKANGIPKASKYGWWYDATRNAANNQLT